MLMQPSDPVLTPCIMLNTLQLVVEAAVVLAHVLIILMCLTRELFNGFDIFR